MQVVLVTPGLVPPLHELPCRKDVDARAVSHYWRATGSSVLTSSDGVVPNMSRKAVLKCAELAKPAAWAASVRDAPPRKALTAAPIRFHNR